MEKEPKGQPEPKPQPFPPSPWEKDWIEFEENHMGRPKPKVVYEPTPKEK